MRKKLLITLFLLFSFIPVFSVSALTGNNGIEYLEPPEGVERFVIFKRKDNTLRLIAIGNDTQYVASDGWFTNIGSSSAQSTNLYFYKVPVSTGTNVGCQDYDQTICTTSYGSSNYSLDLKVYNYTNNTWTLSNVSLPSAFDKVTQLLYSTENIYLRTDITYAEYPSSTYLIPIPYGSKRTKTGLDRAYEFLTYMSNVNVLNLEEKKNFSYNNDEMNNPMRYIDLYFDKEDLGKKINFSIKLEDFFNYSSCSYCEYLNIEKFEFSYLVQDENGLYKWVDISNTSAGVGFDYDGSTFPRNEDGTGLTLNGSIDLDYNTTTYDFEKIRASIKLSNGYNFKYTYSDDSNMSNVNIDEYYHYMTYDGDKRLNRIDGGSTKYTILTTTQENLNAKLVVQYINTDKWLYAEYFDTFNHTYLENSGLYQENYIFGGKDLAISNFTIGKNNNRGIYLMNYLYQRDNKNLNSKYYFYIPTEVSYSTTDFLDEAIYYDNNGNINTTITANPNYETDNLHFLDNLRGIFNFLNELQTTSDTFNYMWNSFYNTMPIIIQAFFKFVTHILCVLIFMKIVGYQ